MYAYPYEGAQSSGKHTGAWLGGSDFPFRILRKVNYSVISLAAAFGKLYVELDGRRTVKFDSYNNTRSYYIIMLVIILRL